ncbi:MAG: DUF2914 domain-containing protein [Alcanivorax sp.]|nr:DUF2914 domain-containing protein [Alcanivorax sp.]
MIPLRRTLFSLMPLSPMPCLAVLFCALLPVLSQADTCPEIGRAGFTGAVAGGEPLDVLDQIPENVRTLFFFTEVLGGTGTTLRHQWQSQESDAVVPLRIGGPSWRTWSSRQIVDPTIDWSVTVTSDSGCQLGVWHIAGNPNATPRPPAAPSTPPPPPPPSQQQQQQPAAPAPAQAAAPPAARPGPATFKIDDMNALLAARDLVGARMLLEAEAERGVDPQLLTRIRQVDLEIASAQREIEADRLYTATTRLTQLAQRHDLTGEERAAVVTLEGQIRSRTAELESDYLFWLAAWRQTMNRGLAGGALCVDPSAFASDWPARITEALSWVDRQTTATGYDFLLIDPRTGRSHVLPLDCPIQNRPDAASR